MAVWIPILLVAAVLAGGQAHAADGWTPLRHERYGFRLYYPSALFQLYRTSEAGDGIGLLSNDGKARILVGAFANQAGYSPAAYQRYLAERSYSSFPVTYAPRGQSWFGLSGECDGRIFYEKVMFSCGNGVITSFAMTYPAAQRDRLDAAVERIENSFRPGRCGPGDSIQGRRHFIAVHQSPRGYAACCSRQPERGGEGQGGGTRRNSLKRNHDSHHVGKRKQRKVALPRGRHKAVAETESRPPRNAPSLRHDNPRDYRELRELMLH